MAKVTITCLHCGKEFQTPNYKLKSGRGKYCSKNCLYENKRSAMKVICCINCGVEFKVRDIKQNTNRKFCKQSCKKAYLVGVNSPKYVQQVTCICQQCNKQFSVKPSDIKKFCSHHCYSIFITRGKNSLSQLERKRASYKTWRKAVFERDNYTCQLCGTRGGVLNAHHIYSWATYPEKRYEVLNGKTICATPCHTKIHKTLDLDCVAIHWIDSVHICFGWSSLEDIESSFPDEIICISVGIKLEETDDYIVIAQSIDYNLTTVSNTLKIPKVAIKGIIKLKFPK